MKLCHALSAGAVCFLFVSPWLAFADDAPPQMQLRTYSLHNNPNSADISPDEHLVVTESTLRKETPDSQTKQFVEVVQVWNFKDDRLLSEFPLQRSDVKASAKGYFRDPIRGARFVRFSPDGKLVIALLENTLHVLATRDLAETQTLQLVAPSDVRQTIRDKTILKKPEIRAMEISPSGDLVAVLWVKDMLYGTIDVYDLTASKRVQSWDTPQGWISFTNNLAWHPDSRLLVVAIPNAIPCVSPSNQPDVFAFDVHTGAIKQKFTTGLLTGSIAVTSDGRILAVDRNCLGVLKNRDPKLRIFDLSTGKKVREVSGRGTGVRYSVSASADGSRFLAFTGKMKTKFDWGDMVHQDVRVDGTFSVWNLSDYQGIVTSQNIPGLNAFGLRLSSKGRYAVSYGKASFVYELP